VQIQTKAMPPKFKRVSAKMAESRAASKFRNFSGARLSQPQRTASQIDFEYNLRASTRLHAAAGTAALPSNQDTANVFNCLIRSADLIN
jgi:hypothetical protein